MHGSRDLWLFKYFGCFVSSASDPNRCSVHLTAGQTASHWSMTLKQTHQGRVSPCLETRLSIALHLCGWRCREGHRAWLTRPGRPGTVPWEAPLRYRGHSSSPSPKPSVSLLIQTPFAGLGMEHRWRRANPLLFPRCSSWTTHAETVYLSGTVTGS